MENQTDSNANTKDAATDTETTNSGTTPGQPLADVTGPKAAEDAAPHVPPEDVEAVFNERKNRNLLGDIFSGLRNKGGLSGVLNNFTMSMDSRNMLQVPCPHYIVFRMFDVITSWQKLSKELIHFSRWGLCGFLKRMWTEPYMLQLVEDLRVQASNDHRLYTDAPLIAKWNSPALQVQQSVYQYVCWRLNIDGGLDVGRHNLPHNQVQKLYWYHLLKTNKLQIHLYPEVSNALSQMTKKTKLILWSSCTATPVTGQFKLISYSQYGDLTSKFTEFWDTSTMNPTTDESWNKIMNKFPKDSKVLFITPSLTEARIAQRNHINPMIILRDDSINNIFLENFDDIPAITRLDEIQLVGSKTPN